MREKWMKAVVEKAVEGKHGPYAIATSAEVNGSITFSLSIPYWEEKDQPGKGVIVILTDLRKKRAGWRAMHARYLRPADER